MKNRETTRQMLFVAYRTIFLSRKQAAECLNMSTSKLDRLRQDGFGPVCIKDYSAKNGTVVYSIDDLAEYISRYDGNRNE